MRYDWESAHRRSGIQPHGVDENLRKQLLDKKPDLAWSHDLLPTDDYQTATAMFEVPDRLEPGLHFLFASPAADFGGEDNLVVASSSGSARWRWCSARRRARSHRGVRARRGHG